MLDRRTLLLAGLDLPRLRGVEIGPLDRPLVRREDGPITYVDYCDMPSLKMIYRNSPTVRVSRIQVDAALGKRSLSEALAGKTPFHYVVASHVIEHTPDLIGWMQQLRDILVDGGEVRLAVPDKRFTFDYMRRESPVAEVLAAYMDRAKRPSRQAMFDFLLNMGPVDLADAWCSKPVVKPSYTMAEAIAKVRADAAQSGAYFDIHCWVFTPRSFADLMATLAEEHLMPFACSGFTDTRPNTLEFLVSARKSDDFQGNAQSWKHMRRQVRQYDFTTSTGAHAEASMAQRIAKSLKHVVHPDASLGADGGRRGS